MWQRFTERARKVVFYAQEEAQNLGEGYVSTEHLLLGLVRESDSLACRVIEAMGVSRDRIRSEVERQVPRGDSRSAPDMTLTPRAKRVIDLSYDEARSLNNNYIGTEHLLLGLVREGEGLAGRVLHRFGIEIDLARQHVISLQQADPSKAPPEPARPPKIYAWDQYDEETQRAILLADKMAKAQGSLHVTPYYLLKALLSLEESTAIRALEKLNIDPMKVDAALEQNQVWAEGAPTINLSPYARQIIDRTAVEADSLQRDSVGSEALLLGLVFGNREGIGRIFGDCGVAPTRLRDAVVKVLEEEKGTS